jgi:hypothetical protein
LLSFYFFSGVFALSLILEEADLLARIFLSL